jgi:hypothetical protein
MNPVRVRIDAPSGLIELEGDREFVSDYLDKLLPLIETTGFGTSMGLENGGSDGAANPLQGEPTAPEATDAATAKKKRRVAKRPPAGASCRERILVLRGEGFFKDHRSVNDIVGGLAKKGWTHKANQVGAALSNMFSGGEIQRTKMSDGASFAYYWDRH